MREIKFRVWDKINNKMHGYGSDEACDLWEDGCNFMGMSFIGCQPNVIWMQYTGLKDKNGKEIYEGDIIGFELDNPWTVVKPILEYLHDNSDGTGLAELFDGVIVIGNIYENPELLGTQ